MFLGIIEKKNKKEFLCVKTVYFKVDPIKPVTWRRDVTEVECVVAVLS